MTVAVPQYMPCTHIFPTLLGSLVLITGLITEWISIVTIEVSQCILGITLGLTLIWWLVHVVVSTVMARFPSSRTSPFVASSFINCLDKQLVWYQLVVRIASKALHIYILYMCLFYMLHLSTHTCTMLHVRSVLHVLFVCFNRAAHTPSIHVHASHLHVHTLVICCLLHNKKQKRGPWYERFACAR